jgi:hypothetical protein
VIKKFFHLKNPKRVWCDCSHQAVPKANFTDGLQLPNGVHLGVLAPFLPFLKEKLLLLGCVQTGNDVVNRMIEQNLLYRYSACALCLFSTVQELCGDNDRPVIVGK